MSQWTQLVPNHQAVAYRRLEGVSDHESGIASRQDHLSIPSGWTTPALNNMTPTPLWGNAPGQREPGE